jgi:hypothetical protein
MTLPQGWIFEVLLNDVGVVEADIYLSSVISVSSLLKFVYVCVFSLGVRILFLL